MRGLSPEDAYKRLKNPLKSEVRNSLVNEQGGLCAYCMCKIPRMDVEPHITPIIIEHMTAQNPPSGVNMGQGLDYSNLVATCNGNRASHGNRTLADLTCDAHKENKEFTKVNPCKPETMATIFYSLDGIVDARMSLVRDKGYVATTTKDITHLAGVNECTLFRKFKNKKDIVLNGITQEKWRANITPDFVNLSIGLRAPQLYSETAPLIMKIPQAFISSLIDYFHKMEQLGKIDHMNFEALAMTVFSSTFGFTFLKASFNQELTKVEQEVFVKNSVNVLMSGILKR